MKSDQFVAFEFENGGILHVNKEFITAYGYFRDKNETMITILHESAALTFPGDQTGKIFKEDGK